MKRIKNFLKILGPGFITGASDDDPSGIATYSQTGAIFGYQQLWTAPFSFPFMSTVQEMCGRIGMVTGSGLSGVLRNHYSKPILYSVVILLFIANTVNVGANLGAMASSVQLLINIPFIFPLIILTLITLFLEIFIPYPVYARFLKYLTLSLLAYIITAFVVRQDLSKIISSTFVPSITFSRDYLLNIVAILGTTISPYLFFWQADEEAEEEIKDHKLKSLGKGVPRVTGKDIRKMRLDTVMGMFLSNLVMFFIIVTTASTLNAQGITHIETADQAAQALKPIAGNFAFLLFTAGIIGTGLLAVPILAGSASYAISEGFGWSAGLYKKFAKAHGFYAVIIIAIALGVIINFTPIKPFQMLYYTAVLNGICAPPLLFMILLISNNKKIMKEHTNSFFSNVMGISITGIMALASLALLLSFII